MCLTFRIGNKGIKKWVTLEKDLMRPVLLTSNFLIIPLSVLLEDLSLYVWYLFIQNSLYSYEIEILVSNILHF